jgi:hypothetical protein
MRYSPLLILILATLGGCKETEEATGCLPVEADDMTCPKPGDVDKGKLFTGMCGYDTVEILGNGTFEEEAGPEAGPACCYPVEVVDEEPDSDCEY